MRYWSTGPYYSFPNSIDPFPMGMVMLFPLNTMVLIGNAGVNPPFSFIGPATPAGVGGLYWRKAFIHLSLTRPGM